MILFSYTVKHRLQDCKVPEGAGKLIIALDWQKTIMDKDFTSTMRTQIWLLHESLAEIFVDNKTRCCKERQYILDKMPLTFTGCYNTMLPIKHVARDTLTCISPCWMPQKLELQCQLVIGTWHKLCCWAAPGTTFAVYADQLTVKFLNEAVTTFPLVPILLKCFWTQTNPDWQNQTSLADTDNWHQNVSQLWTHAKQQLESLCHIRSYCNAHSLL